MPLLHRTWDATARASRGMGVGQKLALGLVLGFIPIALAIRLLMGMDPAGPPLTGLVILLGIVLIAYAVAFLALLDRKVPGAGTAIRLGVAGALAAHEVAARRRKRLAKDIAEELSKREGERSH